MGFGRGPAEAALTACGNDVERAILHVIALPTHHSGATDSGEAGGASKPSSAVNKDTSRSRPSEKRPTKPSKPSGQASPAHKRPRTLSLADLPPPFVSRRTGQTRPSTKEGTTKTKACSECNVEKTLKSWRTGEVCHQCYYAKSLKSPLKPAKGPKTALPARVVPSSDRAASKSQPAVGNGKALFDSFHGCRKCSKRFPRADQLTRHMENAHTDTSSSTEDEDEDAEQTPELGWGGCTLCGVDDDHPAVLCDGCDAVQHLSCLDIQKLPPGDWFCASCRPKHVKHKPRSVVGSSTHKPTSAAAPAREPDPPQQPATMFSGTRMVHAPKKYNPGMMGNARNWNDG